MLIIEPAYDLKPAKGGDVRVSLDDQWEAQYGEHDWSCVRRSCPIQAAADCLNNLLCWLEYKQTC